VRPEDVVVDRDGRVYASDQGSAVAQILPDGSLRRIGRAGGAPNGIPIGPTGRIVIANFELGIVQELDRDTGEISTLCEEVEGRRLTSANYPIVDRDGNIWCTNSTFTLSWMEALDGRADGILFRIRPDGRAELMAEGLRFANGLALDADESHIYVCQTSACDVLQYPIGRNGRLGRPRRYGPVLGDRFPLERAASGTLSPSDLARVGATDGCGFDAEGNLWVTLVIANRIVAITPEEKVVPLLEDPGAEIVIHPTNVSWGGADLRDLYVGSIATDYVVHIRSPVPGLPLFHQR